MRVSIVGLGLIGGSLGLALSKTRLGERQAGTRVIGYARRRETAERALVRGAIDAIAADWAAAAAADVVVVATPVLTVREVLAALTPHLAEGTVVSDVASTKAMVLAWADELLPPGVQFVGGHPMAGSEQSGIEAAQPDLFVGRTYCICPSARADDVAIVTVRMMAESVGARPLVLDAAEHDRLVAGISHLPLVASAALASAVMGDADWPSMAALAASGFRDTTRLAAGDPTMGADILATNGAAVADWLERLIAELSRWRDMIAAGDDARVRAELARLQAAVREWRKQAGYE